MKLKGVFLFGEIGCYILTVFFFILYTENGIKIYDRLRIVSQTMFLGCTLIYNIILLKERKREEKQGYSNPNSEQEILITEHIAFTAHPVDYCGEVNGTAVFTVAAEGNELYYQWQVSHDGGKTWWDIPVAQGGNTATMQTIAEAHCGGFLYRCAVWDDSGKSSISRVAKMIYAATD